MPNATNIIRKKVGEKLLIGMDFTNWLGNESVSSITSVIGAACVDGNYSAIIFGTSSLSGNNVVFTVEGGTAGIRYRIQVTIVTSGGQILIGEGILVIT